MDKGLNFSGNERHSKVGVAASELVNESKKLAEEIYLDGKHKIADAQDSLKNYTYELTHKVQANPITSLLVAGGVGFLLALLLRR